MKKTIITILAVLSFFASSTFCYSWSCKTHTFIAKQAGMKMPEYACIPDEVRHENYNIMVQFHFHGASPNTVVTPEYIQKYNVRTVNVKEEGKSDAISIKIPHESGVLYWKILDLYNKMGSNELKDYQYNYFIMSIAHFIGDLSQPLHNYPFKQQPAADGKIYENQGRWSSEKHTEFDYMLDALYPLSQEDMHFLRAKISVIKIKNSDDLSREVSKIANSSINMANICFRENRIMTKKEALERIAMSISLLKAILKK